MSLELLHQYRFVAVIVLLAVAVSLTTVKGKMPLALRGLRRTLRQDAGLSARPADEEVAAVSGWRRLLAFLLTVAALVVAIAL